MRKLILILLVLSSTLAQADEVLRVESSANDEFLIINGVNFAARSFCHDFQLGDEVVFLSGSPDGSCTEALILNQRTNQACNTFCNTPY